MKARTFVKDALITFIVALVANIVISLLWNYFIKSRGLVVDWGPSIRIALLLGFIIPVSRIWNK